eukprot:4963411-Amphidinium_carterae.1
MNELLSTIESGQKEPHSNNRDASLTVRESRPMLLIACVQLTQLLRLEHFQISFRNDLLQ